MKNNGNNIKTSNYYIGLDVGTDSLGWAVTDEKYNICKFKSKSMWGIRQFPEGESAEERRSNRTNRRRMQRKKQRLFLLEMLFENEIAKKDALFFERMRQSSLYLDDRDREIGRFTLFNDKDFSDVDYLNAYPTIYHLRKELVNNDEPKDVRLVFLALHHIVKKRGHFLYENSNENTGITIEQAINELSKFVQDEYNVSFEIKDMEELKEVLSSDSTITQKKKLINSIIDFSQTEEINCKELCNLLSGAKVTLSKLFNDEFLKETEVKSYSLKDSNDDDNYSKLCDALRERTKLIECAQTVYDIGRIYKIMGDSKFISEAKVNLYEQNKKDLKKLKSFVKEYYPKKYKTIFSLHKDKLNNYAAYSRYKTTGKQCKEKEYNCNQEEFCLYLKKELPKMPDEYADIADKINEKTLLTRLAGTENGLIPYQLNKKELIAILDNASKYLDFLNIKDEDGFSVKEKIVCIFEFRVPYYVGPLSKHDGPLENHWVVRMDGEKQQKIYPWNFDKVVDTQKSAEGFIIKLISKCTYTGEKVLPKNSLLFSEYAALNEINPLKVNGRPIPVKIKKELYQAVFVDSSKKVTKKRISEYLISNGHMTKEDEISGINDTLTSSLKSYHDFKGILDRTGDKDMVEDIIKHVLIYCDDKKMLKNWLKATYPILVDADIKHILGLKYKDWGRLSKVFLTEIYHVDGQGEAFSIMDMLRNTNMNLMQLLSKEYKFSEEAEKYRKFTFGDNQNIAERLDDMYISPPVRRSILQTLKVVDEIVDVKKSAPDKIFIEMARDKEGKNDKKPTKSRKDMLRELYKGLENEYPELCDKLEKESDISLRKKTLYLYYMQLGKCMYSGKPIDLEHILSNDETYDIDHIFPQSKIRDDSFDNKVLVKSELNREKLNTYPIDENIRSKMAGFWGMLHDRGFITDTKYQRLKRNYPLTSDELSAFVSRQLVETRQATKALAIILNELYPKSRIVYSKADNVNDFKDKNKIVKCREVNDLHHAKDAYLNIVVGNVYDTKFTDKFFLNINKENYSLNKVFAFDVKGAWKAKETIEIVKSILKKNNLLTTVMTFKQKGTLFDAQILSKGKGQLATKKDRDIAKYGGYNKVKGVYFCTVEHTDEKNKRQVSIEPVYLYQQALFESDPKRYCEEILGLVEPKVIVPKILNNALVELDGKLLRITGRTGERNLYKHTYQLVVDDATSLYINRLRKYIGRCAQSDEELEISNKDGVSKEGNLNLYELFLDKLNKTVYSRLFPSLLKDLENGKEKFTEMDMLDQSKLLMEILKAFKCDRQLVNLKTLCNKGSCGVISHNSNITNVKSAYMINQSPTGLYEVKVPLK